MAIQILGNTIIDDSQNITSTGNATFGGTVNATGFTVNGSPITASGSGSQTLVSDTMPAPAGYEVGTLWWNSDSTDTSLYVLYQDPVGPNGDIGGKYWIEAAPAPDSIGFNGTHTGDSTFAGNMEVTGRGTFGSYVLTNSNLIVDSTGSGNGLYIGDFDAGNYTATILANGSATFTGEISSGTSSASLFTRNYSGSSPNIVGAFRAQHEGSDKAVIFTDGSATFGQGLTSGSGVNLYPVGQQSIRRDTAGNAIEVLSGGGVSGNITASITNDGSATFAGTGTFSTLVADATGGQVTSEYNFVSKVRSANLGLFLGCTDSNNAAPSNSTVSITSDGSASFAGNVSSNTHNTNQFTIDGQGDVGITNLVYKYQNSNKFTVNNSGTAFFAGPINGTTVGTSDIKFKENIEEAPSQLADIEAFELKTYDWKDSAPLSDELKSKQKLGLIAQEVEEICPEMICEVADQDGDSYKAINHDVLIMKLLGAVKELSAKVAALEAN